MHGAFRVWVVAAIMLSAIEVLYLWRSSADVFVIWRVENRLRHLPP